MFQDETQVTQVTRVDGKCSYPLSCPEIYSWFSQHPHPIKKKKKLVEEDGEKARGDFLPGPKMSFALAND